MLRSSFRSSRRLRIAAVAGLAGAAVLVGAPAHASAPTFVTHTISPEETVGEPRVVVDGSTIYAVAPEGSTTVWKSTDGGASWGPGVATSGGGGDSDLAIDGYHHVWVNDLLGGDGLLASTIPISVSTNGGSSFTHVEDLTTDTGLDHDRAWMAASGSTVVVSARTDALVADGWVLAVDQAGAVTSTTPVTVATDVAIEGPMIAGPAGSFFTIYGGGDGNLYMAKSVDNGAHWASSLIAAGEAETLHLFPTIASDGGSKLYAAWSTDSGNDVDIVRASTFDGTSWSTPVNISDPSLDALSDNQPALFPWVVASSKGAEISYVMAHQQGVNPVAIGGLPNDVGDGADLGGPLTQWDLMVAQTLDGGSTWNSTVAVPDFHTGSICTAGIACVGPQNLGFGNVPTPYDRRELDFIGSALDSSGHLVIPFGRDRTPGDNNEIVVGDLVLSWVDLDVAVQTGGSTL